MGLRGTRLGVFGGRGLVVAGLAAVLGVALCCRLPGLDRSWWLDEVATLRVAEAPLPEALDLLRTTDAHPPLYYVALQAWLAVGGNGEIWVRLLSLLAGVVGVALLGRVAAALFGSRAGWIAAFLAAATWGLCWPAVEARGYIFMTTFSTAAWLACIHGMRAQRLHGWLAGGVALAAAAYSFYYAFHAAIALAAFVLAARPTRRDVLGLATTAAVSLLLFLPWVPSFLEQAGRVAANDQSSFARLDGAFAGPLDFAYEHLFRLAPWRALGRVASLVGVACLVALPWFAARRPVEREAAGEPVRPRPWGRAVVAALLAFIAATLVAAFLGSYISGRYAIFLSALWCVAASGILARRALLWPAIALVAVAAVGSTRESLQLEREDWRGIAHHILASPDATDPIVVVPSWAASALERYLRGTERRVHAWPRDLRSAAFRPSEQLIKPGEPLGDAQVPALQAFLARTDALWLASRPTRVARQAASRTFLRAFLSTAGWRVSFDRWFAGVQLQRWERE